MYTISCLHSFIISYKFVNFYYGNKVPTKLFCILVYIVYAKPFKSPQNIFLLHLEKKQHEAKLNKVETYLRQTFLFHL